MRPFTLAPIAFAWSASELMALYKSVAHDPRFTRIYIGEVVCRKRGILSFTQWLAIAEQLQAAGKEVVFSLPWLINSASDEHYVEKVLTHWSGPIEANDLTAVAAASAASRPFVGGNQLAVYNSATLSWLMGQGMTVWSPPVELGKAWLEGLLANTRIPHVELFAFGQQMLGISARCMHARSAGLSRANCQQLCLTKPSEILKTREDQALLVANGHTIMSSGECNLLALEYSMPEYIGSFRISLSKPEQFAKLDSFQRQMQPNQVNGFWFTKAGMVSAMQ
ncbi:U32 family peptidase [Salinibius halmophilus]|uniref:U32 family peptidase n=1 Tax=Salinibius halmophilus TaxID=1853216 RepID=UPI000E660740|nr:U32 family peptidase [Salinibius halmophilus]